MHLILSELARTFGRRNKPSPSEAYRARSEVLGIVDAC
jgi:hypothetical protein